MARTPARLAARLVIAVGLVAAVVATLFCAGQWVIDRYAGVSTLAPEDAAWLRAPAARDMAAAAFADLNGQPVIDHDVALISVGGRLPGAPVNNSQRLAPGGPLARLERGLLDRAARIAGAPDTPSATDGRYVSYLLRQMTAMPGAYRAVIAGRDAAYDAHGQRLAKVNGQIIDNRYVAWLAGQRPDELAAAVSIHPRAHDVRRRLKKWAATGITRLVWWPGAQHIAPGEPAVAALTPTLVDTGMQVSITVGGVTDRQGQRAWVAPQAVAGLLAAGVPVELRLGAALGADGQDLLPALIALLRTYQDTPGLTVNLGGLIARYDGRALLTGLLQHPQFYDHLVYGSGYPATLVAARIRLDDLVDDGLIAAADAPPLADIRATNPLLFVYVLHRRLRLPGTELALPAAVFTTAYSR